MKRKTLVIIISSFVVLIMLSGVIFLGIASAGGQAINRPAMAQETNADTAADGDAEEDKDYTYIPPTPMEGSTSEEDSSNEISASPEEPFVPATELDLDPSSITVFVNKEYALPKDYKPEHLVTPNVIFNLISYDERTLMRPEAAKALEHLFNDAKQQGIVLYGVSAYRSYERQYTIFTNNIAKKGKTYTLRYSAVPGTSEHQTGLSIDLSAKSQDFKLDDNFASSPEGEWLAENAYKYGYIIRYTKGNEDITGYAFEPWHIRYVGEALANYLYTNKLTLEEYYQYTPSPDFNFEAKYAAIINYVPPVVTKAPVVSGIPVVSGVPVEGDGTMIGEDGKVIDIGEEDTPPKVSPTEAPSNTGPKDTTAPEADDATVTGIPSDSTDPSYTDEQGQMEEGSDTPEDQNAGTPEPGSTTQGGDNGSVAPTPQVTPTPAPASTP